ncbi:twin-arginine translocase subunit TatC [Halovivax gelatinilyticus]|uniref:twin-arginine translocase subunit TatC n=1 Tax=Halovivax gelatinilyticus TaxID=2961597 RepID=UPI0020CA2AFF|nr:twin-arginine translocase subunit TatC [Halovivax gelatinilyticus]
MSSVVDEDTARAVNSGRETIGGMLSAAQSDLQKIFIVFVIGFIGTFYALRVWIWDFLEATATARMGPELVEATDIITRTPFEVILLQAKIGLLFGALLAIPAFIYYSRDAIKRRGIESVVPLSRWYLVGFVIASFSLFAIGVFYAYAIFFPYAFLFLGEVAHNAGVKPSWGITEFTEFVALLTISFGLAAQLPLFMGAFSYTEIVPYETFRDKWRHAIVGITCFGALFSPPDPFTLIMWAAPLVILYAFSLGLAKLIANTRRRGAAEVGSGVAHVKRRTLQFTALVAVAFALIAAALAAGAREWLATEVGPQMPGYLWPDEPTYLDVLVIEHGTLGLVAAALIIAVSIGFAILLVLTLQVLRTPVYPRESQLLMAETADDIDFDVLDAADVDRVPAPVFTSMTEDEMMDVARDALHEDQREKAQAIIDRFDGLHGGDDVDAAASAAGTAAATAEASGDDEGGLFASTAAGVLDPFTEEETTEDDIGGYAYDLAFIFNSLTSRLIYLVGLFMAVLAGSFFWLYAGGIGYILAVFVRRVPDSILYEVAQENDADVSLEEIRAAETNQELITLIQDLDFVIALHPVEVLIFIVKVSTLAAIIAVLPLVLYYAWPAAKERGLVRGDRRLFIVWGGSLFGGFVLGTFLGFFYIAPGVISYLITDAVSNDMVVSYRIKSFFWLVIFTTVGVGFLMNIVVTMALFHVGNIVSYRSMLRYWRPAVVGIFAFAAVVSPRGLLTMLAFAIPIALTYVIGLLVLYVLTAGGRLFGGGGGSTEDVSEPPAGAEVSE